MKETIKAQILDTIAADQTEILAFTQELVAIATENPPGTNYKPCVGAITKKLSEMIKKDRKMKAAMDKASKKMAKVETSFFAKMKKIMEGQGFTKMFASIVPSSKSDSSPIDSIIEKSNPSYP